MHYVSDLLGQMRLFSHRRQEYGRHIVLINARVIACHVILLYFSYLQFYETLTTSYIPNLEVGMFRL